MVGEPHSFNKCDTPDSLTCSHKRTLGILLKNGFSSPVLVFLLALSSCAGDKETLDKFSRAYTAFLDAQFDTEITSDVPMVDFEKEGTYWPELKGAINIRSTDVARLAHATNALQEGSVLITNSMESFRSNIDQLDTAVATLVESANSIHNREYPSIAIEIAAQARNVTSAFASIEKLYREAFRLRRAILSRVAEDHGEIPVFLLKSNGSKIAQIGDAIKADQEVLASSMVKIKDGFGALKGRSGLKAYTSKADGK